MANCPDGHSRSEGLSEANVNDAAWLLEDEAGSAGERRRIEQEAIVYADRADGRVQAQSQADGVRHAAKANVAYLTEDVSEIIERHEPQLLGERIA